MTTSAPALRILARCHVMRPGGAPNMLLGLLRALSERHSVTMLRLENADEATLAPYRLSGFSFADGARPRDFDVLLANTLLSSRVVAQAAQSLPTLWWIHEAAVGRRFIERGMVDTAAFAKATRIVFPGPRQPIDVYGPWLREASWTVVPTAIPPVGQVARQRPDEGAFRVIHVGAVAAIKGQDVTLAALSVLADRRIEVRFVGSDHSAWAQDVRQGVAKTPALSDRVVWLGERAQDSSLQEIADADVLVYPRRVTSFPLAVLEAMTLSVPVIATRCQALSDVLVDGEDALLIPDGDGKALAEAIARLRREPELARRLTQNALKRVVAKRPYSAFAAAMEAELYRAIETFRERKGRPPGQSPTSR